MTISLALTKKHLVVIGVVLVLIVGGILLYRGKNPTHGIQPNSGQTKVITITDSGFSPNNLEIVVGDTVRFENKDSQARWPASDPHPTHEYYPDFDPKKTIAPGESWELTFTKEGTFTFHDHTAPHRRGEIVVGKAQATVGGGDDIKALLAETDKQKRAKIVRGMAEKYGPLEALSLMQQAGLPFDGETHLLVHEIGNVAYVKYGDQALRYCTDAFLSACYHGVILNEIGESGFEGVARLMTACKDAGPLVIGQCSHGAGHGFLAWQDYKLTSALPYCDKLNEKDSATPTFNCFDGVFMENLFGVHEGKPSQKRWIKADDPDYPCNVVAEKYKNGCYADQASVMYELYKGDLKKVAVGCNRLTNTEYKRTCFDNFSRQIHPMVQGDINKTLTFCANAPSPWNDQCLITIMNAEFSVGGKKSPLSYQLCPKAVDSSKRIECYQTLLSNVNTYGSSAVEKRELCGLVTEPTNKQLCLDRYP